MSKRRIWKFLWFLLLGSVCLVAGCTGSESQDPEPPSPREQFLGQVRDLLENWNIQAHYLTIAGEMTFSLWLEYPSHEMIWELFQDRPIELMPGPQGLALGLGWLIFQENSQARELFEIFNPMVVDSEQNSLYLDMIPLEAITAEPQADRIIQTDQFSAHRRSYGYLRLGMPRDSQTGPAPLQPWPQIREELLEQIPGDNRALYRIVGRPGDEFNPTATPEDLVQAQWVSFPDDPEIAVNESRNYFEILLGRLHEELPGLSRFEVFVVTPQGQMRYFITAPPESLGPDGPDPGSFRLRRF